MLHERAYREGPRALAVCALCLVLLACGGDESPDDSNTLERVTDPLPDGDPIEAPDDTWTWVDFPDTRCMNDEPTGLGVRLHEGSDEVLIYIQGGGACFNATTCLASANPNGFGAEDLDAQTSLGLLDETDPDNPFRNWNKVFIPYCSGDIFSGMAQNRTGFEGRTQMGYLNMRAYLTRLVPTFKDVKHVVLSGYSAGGFAASINWIQGIEAWGQGVRIDVLNDSGPPMGEEYLTPCLQQRLAEVWNWSENVPAACTDCDIPSGKVTEPVMRFSIAYTSQYRHALISSNDDFVIKLFYGYGLNECADIDGLLSSYPAGKYADGLMHLNEEIFGEHPGARAFLIDSASHVWTTQSPGKVMSNGVRLKDWLEDFLDPESDWESVTP